MVPKNREKAELVKLWMEKASSDLRAASYLMTMNENCPFDAVCFHAQQAVEKMLKALLIDQGDDIPKIHDLTQLRCLIPEQTAAKISASDMAELNPYSVMTRYPGIYDNLGYCEAQDAIAIACRIETIVRESLIEAGNSDK